MESNFSIKFVGRFKPARENRNSWLRDSEVRLAGPISSPHDLRCNAFELCLEPPQEYQPRMINDLPMGDRLRWSQECSGLRRYSLLEVRRHEAQG